MRGSVGRSSCNFAIYNGSILCRVFITKSRRTIFPAESVRSYAEASVLITSEDFVLIIFLLSQPKWRRRYSPGCVWVFLSRIWSSPYVCIQSNAIRATLLRLMRNRLPKDSLCNEEHAPFLTRWCCSLRAQLPALRCDMMIQPYVPLQSSGGLLSHKAVLL